VAFKFIHAFSGVGGRIKKPNTTKNVKEEKKKNTNITPKRFTYRLISIVISTPFYVLSISKETNKEG